MKAAHALVLAASLAAGPALADDAGKGEDVTFKTADGLTIAATYWPPAAGSDEPAPVVVALPMYRHERASYGPMVRPLTDRGMGLLALDLRGHGGSAKQGDEDLGKKAEARDPTLFNAMHEDVAAAVAWLAKEKKTPKGKVALLGASVGCSVAIDAAVRAPDDVAAVVTLTPGANYLGVPTMEHVARWPRGKPLLLVTSDAEAKNGASQILGKLDGKGAELRIVSAADAAAAQEQMALHGTNMFGRVQEIENNVADWLAYRLTFRRLDLGGGVVAMLGSTGEELYVGVETPEGTKVALDAFVVRVGTGGVTDPWSKTATIEVGRRFETSAKDAPNRRRTRLSRFRLGVEAGKPFAVAVSLDGKNFLPADGGAPLFFTVR